MRNPRYREIHDEAPDGQILTALLNGDVGWLMYLRSADDAGFSSRNPAYLGDDDARIEYVLSNGQVDEYPAAWALPASEIFRALAYFHDHRKAPPFITWHNDSQDGTVLGA
jgi:hypothetical protein